LRLKILKKLRTASLNSEFTGSYKKSVLYSSTGIAYSKQQKKSCEWTKQIKQVLLLLVINP